MSTGSVHKEQLEPTSAPVIQPGPSQPHTTKRASLGGRVARIRRKVTTKDGWFGDYDYKWCVSLPYPRRGADMCVFRLCMPSLPFNNQKRRLPPFYALDAELPLVLAISSGLQHSLAMLAGLITPPIIFASSLNLDSATSSYMISASLIGCGEPRALVVASIC